MMKLRVTFLLALGLSACSEPAPKFGAMPGIATGGYEAPSNAEASAAYMAGFQARYDIPELDYPDDIKQRIITARLARLQKDMRVAEKRQKIMSKLALTVMARKDPEAKRLLEDIKNNSKASDDEASINWVASVMDIQPQRTALSKSERQHRYSSAIRDYRKAFRNLEIENCRWTEMKRLIGSGHEAMAFIHGEHPTHGFQCVGEMKTERNKGYPRLTSFRSFWVKTSSGDWRYYGTFPGVGIAPRRQSLDPAVLSDPEKTILKQSSWDWIASQLN